MSATSDARGYLAALEAVLAGRDYETNLCAAGLTVIAPVDPLGFRLTTVVTCRARPDDGDRLWFFADGRDQLTEVDRVIDAAMAVATRLRPLLGATP